MEKIVLVDGNNLVFRSYYATAYNGNFMKTSKGFPTNALFGFVNMINKIVLEEKPTYIIVAFDKGKTFRHDKYKDYKGGRMATPEELKVQMPVAKELLTYMGIKYYEIDNYEADDIIGTFAEFCDKDSNFIGTIVSSDKDLLQLITNDVDIKLLKMKDYIRYNEKTFKEEYGINPINVIDLKALMGDPSDNIKGVSGIGEKTALKLLHDYKTLDGIYENIDKLSLKMQEKLINDKANAYMSYELATIERHVPLDITIDDLKIKEKDAEKLNSLYEELEFYSFIKKEEKNAIKKESELKYKIILNPDDLVLTKDSSIYIELLGTNYHSSKILGLGIYNDTEAYYINNDLIEPCFNKLKDFVKYTYDLKKLYVALRYKNLNLNTIQFDTMVAAYLLEYNIKEDIAYLANSKDYDIPFYENVYMKTKTKVEEPSNEVIALNCIKKAKFIYETQSSFSKELEDNSLIDLFKNIEMPLSIVLGDMEYTGVHVNKEELLKMKEEISCRIIELEQEIYELSNTTFNISSPLQLGEVLFEKLNLPHGKKTKTGYSTSADILEKIKDHHPIVDKILEYRMITKLYTTYIEGLMNVISDDSKIHTIYTQTLTRTGRLSSIEPNLQNIPVRSEYGRLIRKAFVPSNNSVIVSGDYSQIELRILSDMANVDSMKQAFKNNIDIHTKTASDIFHIKTDEVTSNQRRIAKAVNFGIIYGISSFGLSENIKITPKEAKIFIDNYLDTYPGIKEYMDSTIKKAHEDGYVRTMFNRKRSIPELNNKNYMIRSGAERMALNTPIQGTSADIIKKAMVEIFKRFNEEKLKSKMILQVHDELIFDCLKEEEKEVISIAKEVMENIIKISVPLNVEFASGENWYQAK